MVKCPTTRTQQQPIPPPNISNFFHQLLFPNQEKQKFTKNFSLSTLPHTNIEVAGGSALPQIYPKIYQKNLSTYPEIQSNMEVAGGSNPFFNQKFIYYSHSIKKIIKNQDFFY